jgi:hypothetical protein
MVYGAGIKRKERKEGAAGGGGGGAVANSTAHTDGFFTTTTFTAHGATGPEISLEKQNFVFHSHLISTADPIL